MDKTLWFLAQRRRRWWTRARTRRSSSGSSDCSNSIPSLSFFLMLWQIAITITMAIFCSFMSGWLISNCLSVLTWKPQHPIVVISTMGRWRTSEGPAHTQHRCTCKWFLQFVLLNLHCSCWHLVPCCYMLNHLRGLFAQLGLQVLSDVVEPAFDQLPLLSAGGKSHGRPWLATWQLLSLLFIHTPYLLLSQIFS